MCSALLALGVRWKILIDGGTKKPNSLFLTAALCSALLLNYAIPGPFGEVAAAWFVHRRYSISMVDALVSGTAARLLGLATAALGTIVLWHWTEAEPSLLSMIQAVVMGVGIGFVLLCLLMFLPFSWREWLAKKGEENRTFLLLHGFAEAFLRLRSMRKLLWSSIWSCVGHLMAYIGVWLSIFAVFGVHSPHGIAYSYLMGTCVGAVAFLFPGSQLTWDASLATLLFASTDLSVVDAGVMTAILRVEQLAMMLLGALSLFWIQSRLKG
jgi:uncharacterized membrane protein YbhN (UPF0104 family)